MTKMDQHNKLSNDQYLLPTPQLPLIGNITIPGSKSISNRMLLLACFAHGVTVLENLLDSADTQVMLRALTQLGVSYQYDANLHQIQIFGNGGGFSLTGEYHLDLGNAGTVFRPLLAALAVNRGNASFYIDGEPRMRQRPLADLIRSLRSLGCNIICTHQEGYAPLIVSTIAQSSRQLANYAVTSPVVSLNANVSSQFLTALLMIAPTLPRGLTILLQGELISRPYIALTIACMARFGVQVTVSQTEDRFMILPQVYQALSSYVVEGDASSASYFLLAGAVAGRVTVRGINAQSQQGDLAFVQVLESMGAIISYQSDSITASVNHELVARTGYPLQAIDADLNHIPDAAMTVAMACLFTPVGSVNHIRNIGSWKVKETDRLVAMHNEFQKLGVQTRITADQITIIAPATLQDATIATYQDHRMAMCFSLASLHASRPQITINNPNCVAKTFPNFFTLWQQLVTSQIS